MKMLGVVDICLLVGSVLITVAIGLYHSIKGRKATTTEYMLGGRTMSPLPLAMSLTMGTISSVTMMGNIGEMYTKGTQLWMMDVGVALGMVVVAELFIPIFYPMKMVSVYQYIEERFKSRILRIVAVVINILAATIFLGFLLYPPSLISNTFLELGQIPNIIIMGLTCGLYSAFGGVKAVVHTDVVQSIVMLLGVLIIVIRCLIDVGGLSTAWQIASERGRIEFFNMDMNPYQRHSFWLTITFGFFFSLNTYGVTQSQTQRTFSTGSVKLAKRVIYYAIFGMLLFRTLINLAGVVIFAFYKDCDILTEDPSKPKFELFVVILYVLNELTKIPGLAGLFVASIYAAVLSSISTQVNSMTALIWEDFLKNWSIFKNWSDVKITWLQKLIVFLTSIVGVLACIGLVFIDSNTFITLLLKLSGIISGPMVGLFFTGLYLPWVRGKPAAFGFLISIAFSCWIGIGQFLYESDPPYLPVSHEGCSSASDNATDTSSFSNSTVYEYEAPPTMYGNHPLYGLSYCLNYCWGTLATLVFSLIATAFGGWNTPDTLADHLVSPFAWKVFCALGSPSYAPPLPRLWRSITQKRSSYQTEDAGTKVSREENYKKSDLVNTEESIAMYQK